MNLSHCHILHILFFNQLSVWIKNIEFYQVISGVAQHQEYLRYNLKNPVVERDVSILIGILFRDVLYNK